jgi:hypothetical protein
VTTCTCACHVNPFGWVPVCPNHHLPLYAAEAGRGQCPWTGRRLREPARQVGGAGFVRQRCTTWAPQSWEWRPRELFNLDDLPPFNGLREPRYPEPNGGDRWQLHEHSCPGCAAYLPHVVGENRSVCTRCGLVSWRPDPAYVDEAL